MADIYDANGNIIEARPGNDPQLWNKFLNIEHEKKEIKKDRFLGSYYLDVTLPFDIKYRSNVGIDIGPWYGNEFYGALSSDRSGSPARAVNARDNRRMYTWENLLFYNKTFKKRSYPGLDFPAIHPAGNIREVGNQSERPALREPDLEQCRFGPDDRVRIERLSALESGFFHGTCEL